MEVVAGSFLLFRFCPSSMMAVVTRSKQVDCCSVVFVSTDQWWRCLRDCSCCSVAFVSTATSTRLLLLFVRWIDDPTVLVSMMYAKQLSNAIRLECYTQ